MKGSKEIKSWINKQRRRQGKKNGVVKWLWEDVGMDIKDCNSKKLYDRKDSRLPQD